MILYNKACCHQTMWELSKCSECIEGVTMNLGMSLKEDEDTDD